MEKLTKRLSRVLLLGLFLFIGSAISINAAQPQKRVSTKKQTTKKFLAMPSSYIPRADLQMFGLKGNVKSVKYGEGDDKENVTYYFNKDGYLSNVTGHFDGILSYNYRTSKDSYGLLQKAYGRDYDMDGERISFTAKFIRDNNGRIVKYVLLYAGYKSPIVENKIIYNTDGSVQILICKSEYDDYKIKYQYDERGFPIRPDNDDAKSYKYLKVDKFGNWTERECHNENEKDIINYIPYIESRKITYYE